LADLKLAKGKHSMSGSVPDDQSTSKSSRRFPRYPLNIHLSVHVFRSGESVSFWGRSSELGEDGIGATMTGALESGEVVSMELSLPRAAGPIKFRALVRYRDGLRHGFEFLALSGAQRDEIRRVCEMLAAAM
jgi:PilZ domain-containing protein